jgi:hypothetical protein
VAFEVPLVITASGTAVPGRGGMEGDTTHAE